MSGKPRSIAPEVVEGHRAKITLLASQARLAEEELEMAIDDCLADNVPSRQIAGWVERGHGTVVRMGARGREARNRRGSSTPQP